MWERQGWPCWSSIDEKQAGREQLEGGEYAYAEAMRAVTPARIMESFIMSDSC